MGARTGTLFMAALALSPIASRADDLGPRGDVGAVRADARVLLAHRARLSKADPNAIVVSDVVIVGDQALLSWDIGKQHGLMGLVRDHNRWWDALDATSWDDGRQCWSRAVRPPLYPKADAKDSGYGMPSDNDLVAWGFSPALVHAAAARNRDITVRRSTPPPSYPALVKAGCDSVQYELPNRVPVNPNGGVPSIQDQAEPYQLALRFARNDAGAGTTLSQLYARPPTPAEFLPYPTPYRVVADAVMFFDITIEGPKPVSFQRGTTIDVWFPFALDDKLRYSMSIGGGSEPIGPLTGTIFDNVVHFELPGFTALPKQTLMGEIDGDPH